MNEARRWSVRLGRLGQHVGRLVPPLAHLTPSLAHKPLPHDVAVVYHRRVLRGTLPSQAPRVFGIQARTCRVAVLPLACILQHQAVGRGLWERRQQRATWVAGVPYKY